MKGIYMQPSPQQTLLRLPQVLARFPVSRSGWYAGVKCSKYPAPIKTGPRTAMWRASEIETLIASIGK